MKTTKAVLEERERVAQVFGKFIFHMPSCSGLKYRDNTCDCGVHAFLTALHDPASKEAAIAARS